ncbi:MAG: creatininase family protein, partial [Planctomycetota bacterium]|nr:creatininase family protein [Planctomycetota bacterium]
IVFPDIARKKNAEKLTEEFRSGACHAGQFETSLVLAVRPELVNDDVRRQLEPNRTNLAMKIKEGAQSFEEAGGPRAYFGDPGAATVEEGESTYRKLTEILLSATLDALRGE